MSMTKKEQQQVADMARRLRLLGALRFTTKVEPDVPAPGYGSKGLQYTSGWTVSGYGDRAGASPAWSGATSHGTGELKLNPQGARLSSGSQGGKALYSSRLLALRAARNMIEADAAKKLADLDEMIDAEEQAMKEAAQ